MVEVKLLVMEKDDFDSQDMSFLNALFQYSELLCKEESSQLINCMFCQKTIVFN